MEDFLLLIKIIADIRIEQTRAKPQEMLEFKLNRSFVTFPFDIPMQSENKCLLGLCRQDVYNSLFEQN